jgi:hypothetical protein
MSSEEWQTIFEEFIQSDKKTAEQKEKIIAQALETEEGRQALAAAMVEPIRAWL